MRKLSLLCFEVVCRTIRSTIFFRSCPPDLLQDALVKFDDHFQNMVAESYGRHASRKTSGTRRHCQ